jgi:putative endonuclease
MSEKFYIYIITNKKDGVLYIRYTNNLKRRIYQHKNKVHPTTFSARYNLDILVYYEVFNTKEEALLREARFKKWNREWKINLINEFNEDWKDLYNEIKV